MHVNGTPRERRSSGYGDRQLNFHRAGSLKDRTPGKLAAWLYDVPGIDKLNRGNLAVHIPGIDELI